jgi:hypothetical protein
MLDISLFKRDRSPRNLRCSALFEAAAYCATLRAAGERTQNSRLYNRKTVVKGRFTARIGFFTSTFKTGGSSTPKSQVLDAAKKH